MNKLLENTLKSVTNIYFINNGFVTIQINLSEQRLYDHVKLFFIKEENYVPIRFSKFILGMKILLILNYFYSFEASF